MCTKAEDGTSKCSKGLAVQALRLFKIFCLSLFEKRGQKGIERPQGYQSNPALHLEPCGVSRSFVFPGLGCSLLTKEPLYVSRAVHDPEDLDSVGERTVEGEIALEALHGPNAYGREAGIPKAPLRAQLGHLGQRLKSHVAGVKKTTRHIDAGVLSEKYEMIRQVSFRGKALDITRAMDSRGLARTEPP